MPFLLNPGMINILHRDGDVLLILIHTALEPDFLRMARQRAWPVTPAGDPPEPYVSYEVIGERPCDEVEKRARERNPWWAFDDSNQYP